MFRAEILADSVSPAGYRLTTFEIEFPRFILPEFNTHRTFSRNSASSRAVPIHKQIERVKNHPFVPIGFGGAQKGMVAAENLSGWKAKLARALWLYARFPALAAAKGLEKLGVHKAFANRLLEPWMWHTVIVTATEWDNFFALRTDENAQPEIQVIAGMMKKLYDQSEPQKLLTGDWHLPLVDLSTSAGIVLAMQRGEFDFSVDPFYVAAMVSAGRCARVSYDMHMLSEEISKSITRAQMLASSGHWSPFEHQAEVGQDPLRAMPYNGNFRGEWMQFRKKFPNEDNFAKLKEAA